MTLDVEAIKMLIRLTASCSRGIGCVIMFSYMPGMPTLDVTLSCVCCLLPVSKHSPVATEIQLVKFFMDLVSSGRRAWFILHPL